MLRLLVARYGEMDGAKWWNSQGMLGRYGSVVLSRGFPKTYLFAQARVVMAIARNRCNEVFNPPKCLTLWNLPAQVEDQFEDSLLTCLEAVDEWTPFFTRIQPPMKEDLLDIMQEMALFPATRTEEIQKLRRSAEGRAVSIPGASELDDDLITLLAEAFSKGETGKLAVPYAKVEGFE